MLASVALWARFLMGGALTLGFDHRSISRDAMSRSVPKVSLSVDHLSLSKALVAKIEA